MTEDTASPQVRDPIARFESGTTLRSAGDVVATTPVATVDEAAASLAAGREPAEIIRELIATGTWTMFSAVDLVQNLRNGGDASHRRRGSCSCC